MNLTSYLETHKNRFIDELIDLLKIKSVSADPAYEKEVRKAAVFTKEKLEQAGCEEAEVIETAGHPIVFAQKIVDPSLPTILVYGHYDVQPPDPLELWESGPFDPVIKPTKLHPEGAIFARGACDDKGQFYMHVKAVEAMIAENCLPCNVKFMIEGEEEVGSDSLGDFLVQYKDKLASDIILISDTAMVSREIPSIQTGLRGLSYVEVEVTGPNRDLHSGVYGGAVVNPINTLSKMIASLHDAQGKITIPGFYDKVVELSNDERAAMASVEFNLNEYMDHLEVKAVDGEQGYSPLERASIRPTLDVNGIWGGYTGEGAKTVLPSKAFAKISMRLVPDQDYQEITRLFTSHFEKIAPEGVRVKVIPHHGGAPYVTPIDSIGYLAAEKAMEITFNRTPVPQRGGGSIPIVALFESVLGIKSVLMGFGLDSDAIHSPNENFGLYNYFKGIETIPHFFDQYTKLTQKA